MNLTCGSSNLIIEGMKLIHGSSKQTLRDIKLSWVSIKKSCENPKQNNERAKPVREGMKMICESNNLKKVVRNKVAGLCILLWSIQEKSYGRQNLRW
jgi:hypothetical protein